MLAGAIYASETRGNDETGDGTEKKPFKTAIHVRTLKSVLKKLTLNFKFIFLRP